jgi:hypothetical protein
MMLPLAGERANLSAKGLTLKGSAAKPKRVRPQFDVDSPTLSAYFALETPVITARICND